MDGPDGDCVIYSGSDSGKGYQRLWIDGRLQYAHRWVWEQKHGPIPTSMEIDHLCYERGCVNIDHLECVSKGENMRRKAARQTHCVNGHERNEINSWTDPKTNRKHCRVCGRDRMRVRRELARGRA